MKIDRENYEGGQAMVEFAIVFPLLFLLFLTIVQFALLYTARQVVQYAAFAAARSAIVWIPERIEEDGDIEEAFRFTPMATIKEADRPFSSIGRGLSFIINHLKGLLDSRAWAMGGGGHKEDEKGSEVEDIPSLPGFSIKFNKVHRAAALACIPISPKLGFNIAQPFSVVEKIGRIIIEYNKVRLRLTAELLPIFALYGLDDLDIPGTEFTNHIAAYKDLLDISDVATTGLIFTGIEHSLGLEGDRLGERFVTARLLTGLRILDPITGEPFDAGYTYQTHQDITVEVTHYYALRVPVINKMISFLYMTYFLPNQIAKDLKAKDLPDWVVHKVIREVNEAYDRVPADTDLLIHYLPIRARSTLSIEGEVQHGPCCSS